MSTSAISSVPPGAAPSHPQLQKTASGEYTAESVDANPALAAGLIKLKDGNYGVPIVAAADRYTGFNSDLTTLKRGG